MTPDQQALAQGILLTDQYQLTMAQLYYRLGLHEKDAQFEHFFRSYPDYGTHKAGYCISAGLTWLLDWMAQARFGAAELAPLRAQVGRTGRKLFDADFLDWLSRHGDFGALHVSAVPEGRVVHPSVPLTVVRGPLILAQLLETALLNQLNFQTLIATKASRVRAAGRDQTVLEFGARRAQGLGALAGARGALIGGAAFSSNVGISHALGLDPKGTHAHSMIQVFIALGEGELGAFQAYADIYPDDCLLLVDTIDTLESGIPNAIRVFETLRRRGHEPVGIRLDSGDLAHLSVRAADMLNRAGFPDTAIVLSNQLDELVIWQIITQIQIEAPRYGLEADEVIGRLIFGVGTSLITSAGDAALDGVYKLVAICQDNAWLPAIKISETPEKTLNPGDKRIWRLYDKRGLATADLLALADEEPAALDVVHLHHPVKPHMQRSLPAAELSRIEPLLVDAWADGRPLAASSIDAARRRRDDDLALLDPGVQRIMNPHIYHVSLSAKLWQLKQDLIRQTQHTTRGASPPGSHPA